MRRKLTATITALALALTVFAVPVSAAGGDNLISRVGAKERSVAVGQELELEVKEGRALNDNDIKWTSSNTSVLKYAENDRYDDEMEFKAVKKGKATVTAKNLETGGKIYFYVTVKAKANNIYISRIGNKNRSVNAGSEFELSVKKGSGLSDNNILWTSSNTSVVKYDDDDRYDNEMEFKAVKAGKSTITAKNLKTGGKVYYYVTVKSNVGPYNIARVGNAKRYVEADDDIDLKVLKGSKLKNSQIKWAISDTSLLRFEDGDKSGTEVEVEAKGKAGTAKVTAHNLKTGGKLVYTVVITPDYDD